MIKDHWYCVAGVHYTADRRLAAVWLGHDRPRDTINVFDSVILRRTVPVVMAERLNAGDRRWLPVSWYKPAAEIADKLLLCGCNMEPEPVDSSDSAIEALRVAFEERLISERLKRDSSLTQWGEEYESLRFAENKIPTETHPLMSATLCAFAKLDYARRRPKKSGENINYPKVAIV